MPSLNVPLLSGLLSCGCILVVIRRFVRTGWSTSFSWLTVITGRITAYRCHSRLWVSGSALMFVTQEASVLVNVHSLRECKWAQEKNPRFNQTPIWLHVICQMSQQICPRDFFFVSCVLWFPPPVQKKKAGLDEWKLQIVPRWVPIGFKGKLMEYICKSGVKMNILWDVWRCRCC